MKNKTILFKKKYNQLTIDITNHLAHLININNGLRFISLEEVEDGDVMNGDMIEYRNQITGNVFDSYPSMIENDSIKAFTHDGIPLENNITINQLGLSTKISLIEMIEDLT